MISVTIFFTSRISQDWLENLFFQIRLKNEKQNAVQLKNKSKLIMMSRYMKYVEYSNNNEDAFPKLIWTLDNILSKDFALLILILTFQIAKINCSELRKDALCIRIKSRDRTQRN